MKTKTAIRAGENVCRMHTPYDMNTEQLSLNGIWKILVYKNLQEIPEDWAAYIPGEEDREIIVPGCLETQGIGTPVYTNIPYPFLRGEDRSFEKEVTRGVYELNAPAVPEENLTVCYYRTFVLPDNASGKKIFLNFEGVETSMLLSINGKYIGFSEDSKLDAEFDITDVVVPGENRIAVQVRSFSAGSYLEDQDYWHLHGIYRPVTLYLKDPARILDFQVKTSFGGSLEDAALDLRVWVSEDQPLFGENSIRVTLSDPEGKEVFVKDSRRIADYIFYLDANYVMHERYRVASPMLWDCERPNLYNLKLELMDPEGNVRDTVSAGIGFREVRIENGILELNRKRLIIRGADLHEASASGGRTVSAEELTQQLYAMKRLNFNAVRTSHYPKQHEFYDLCDRLGLYVVDEANIETHGYGGALSDDPLWLDAYLQRGVRMALRDKNHPCVIIWSMGNESGLGANHAAIRGWLKFYDDRPVQYESGGSPGEISDIICSMYPSRDWIETCMEQDDRPFICCEYVYAKSNSNGNADMYWDLVRHFKRFQGGFVWDFIDKALEQKNADGTVSLRYAGAFGEKLTDRCPDMCLNGVIFADLKDKPAAQELMINQAPVYVKYTDWHGMFGGYRIFNEFMDSDLSDLEIGWTLVCDGTPVESGIYEDLTCEPGGMTLLPMNYDRSLVSGEAFVNISVRRKEETEYAEAGSEIYRVQLEAEGSSVYLPKMRKTQSDERPVVRYTDECAENAVLEVVLDRNAAGIAEVRHFGKTVFENVQDRFYRAPTGIDEGQDDNCFNTEWLAAGLHDPKPVLLNREISFTDRQALIREEVSFCSGRIHLDREYAADAGGIRIRSTVRNSAETGTLPRIGIGLTLPKSFEYVSWYGRGPHENYADRKKSALVGRYEKTVSEMHEEYVRPCECGGREDVRELTISDGTGAGLYAAGDRNFHFSVLPWSVEDYTKADYQEDLPERTATYLCLDGFHAGLGGDTGWTKNIHPEYRIPKGIYSCSLDLRLI